MAKTIKTPGSDKLYTKLSVFFKGAWYFVDLGDPTYAKGLEQYFQMVYPFGLVKDGETNPSKVGPRGEPGDYVAKASNTQEMAVVTKDYYNKMVKPKNTVKPSKAPLNSNALQDPSFLTKVVEKDASISYNESLKQKTSATVAQPASNSKPSSSGTCTGCGGSNNGSYGY